MKKKKWWKILLILVGVVLAVDIAATFYFFNVSQVRNNKVPGQVSKSSKNYNLVQKFDQLSKSTESLTNHGVKLIAWYVPAAVKTDKTVVVVHGYRSNKEAMRQYGELFHELGYNVLMPDNRGAGASGGNLISYGYWDKFDIIAWTQKLVAANPQSRITLFGVSMGGATVMMASGEASLPVNVKDIIEDCGYTNVWDETAYQAKQMYNLPKFPLIYEVSAMSKIRAGWSYGEASSTKELAKNIRPMLFIHGGSDSYVPTYMVYQNYAADPDSQKQLLVVPKAIHAKSFETDPTLYRKTVTEFLGKYAD